MTEIHTRNANSYSEWHQLIAVAPFADLILLHIKQSWLRSRGRYLCAIDIGFGPAASEIPVIRGSMVSGTFRISVARGDRISARAISAHADQKVDVRIELLRLPDNPSQSYELIEASL